MTPFLVTAVAEFSCLHFVLVLPLLLPTFIFLLNCHVCAFGCSLQSTLWLLLPKHAMSTHLLTRQTVKFETAILIILLLVTHCFPVSPPECHPAPQSWILTKPHRHLPLHQNTLYPLLPPLPEFRSPVGEQTAGETEQDQRWRSIWCQPECFQDSYVGLYRTSLALIWVRRKFVFHGGHPALFWYLPISSICLISPVLWIQFSLHCFVRRSSKYRWMPPQLPALLSTWQTIHRLSD